MCTKNYRINEWKYKMGRGCLYHKLISEAAFQFGIRFTDKSFSDLFDLIFLINGKVISLHRVIKYVNRDKVFSTISAQHIRLVNLKSSMYLHYVTILSPWKGTWPFLWTNLNPPYPRMYLCQIRLKLVQVFWGKWHND